MTSGQSIYFRHSAMPHKKITSSVQSLLCHCTVLPAEPEKKMMKGFHIMKMVTGAWKGRRKDKDSPTPPVSEETRPYLEEDLIRERITDVDFCKLVSLPPHLDYNEWLATNAISFFNHVNLFYGAISEYCTNSACAVMNAPFNVQYFWQDEKGKKCKCSAPQYTDLVTSFIEKTINDETVFPTKYGNVFPSAFETIVKRIHRYLFQILAHIYQAHFKEVILLSILGHLNSVFLHFMTFNLRFNLLEEKETEVLYDLYKALSQPMPDRNQNEQGPVDRNQSDDNNDVVVDEDGTDVLGKGTGNVENGVIGNGVAGNGFLTNDVTGSGDAGHDPQQQQQQQQTGSRDECVTGNGNRKLILTDSHVLQTLEDHRSVVSAERLTVTELIAPDSAANSNSIQQPAAILTT